MPAWLIGCVWALILTICLLQASVSSAIERPNEWKLVTLDWLPWILVAPIVMWISARWPIEQRTWKWSVPTHLILSLIVSVSLGALSWRSMLYINPPLSFRWRTEGGVVNTAQNRSPDFRSGPNGQHVLIEGRSFAQGPGEEHHAGEPPPLPPRYGPEDAYGHGGAPPPGAAFPNGVHPQPPPRRHIAGLPFLFLLTRGRGSVAFYWMLLAVTHAVGYHRKSVVQEKQALAAETRLAEARLMALQAQLHPHFLFNTLNAISSMVYDKPAAADAMICALSELLRRVLQASTKREVSLKEEIALARSYVAIQQVRFGEALQVVWELPEATLQAAVPTLLLQPLIENAVVHAVEAENGQGKIVVRAEKSGEQLNLTVQDTGSSASWPQQVPTEEKSTGIGLSNTRARLAELYGEHHLFRFTQEPGAGAKVEISIPFRTI